MSRRRHPRRPRRAARTHAATASPAAPAGLDFSLPDHDEADETPVERQARLFAEMHQQPRRRSHSWAQAVGTQALLFATMALLVGTLVFAILRWLEAR